MSEDVLSILVQNLLGHNIWIRHRQEFKSLSYSGELVSGATLKSDSHWTVRVRLMVCVTPPGPVAITCTVDVPDGVVGVDLPPQPAKAPARAQVAIKRVGTMRPLPIPRLRKAKSDIPGMKKNENAKDSGCF